MKVSISNIAWSEEIDDDMYQQLKNRGITGLEIAPSRLIKNAPYDCMKEAKEISESIKEKYGLKIPSMQSIWYGKRQSIFESEESRRELFEYTKKAIDFAEIIGCYNLVFGCPKNRNVPEGVDSSIVHEFFHGLGEYAFEHNTVLSLEANPKIYNTNFINTTEEAVLMVRKIDSRGFMVNYDLGTCISNNEDLIVLEKNIDMINHIHISEPYLEKIEQRETHKNLASILRSVNYDKYVSIEMKYQNKIEDILEVIDYVMEVFQ